MMNENIGLQSLRQGVETSLGPAVVSTLRGAYASARDLVASADLDPLLMPMALGMNRYLLVQNSLLGLPDRLAKTGARLESNTNHSWYHIELKFKAFWSPSSRWHTGRTVPDRHSTGVCWRDSSCGSRSETGHWWRGRLNPYLTRTDTYTSCTAGRKTGRASVLCWVFSKSTSTNTTRCPSGCIPTRTKSPTRMT